MAALVQSFPQQTGTVTMLQTRPASAGGIISNSQGQPAQQYAAPQQRHSFYAGSNMNGQVVYRASPGPIQPYAFTSTPSLNVSPQRPPQQQQQQQQQAYAQSNGMRASSAAPQLPRIQGIDDSNTLAWNARQPASASMVNLSTGSSSNTLRHTSGSRDDLSLPGRGVRRGSGTPRPHSAFMAGSGPQLTFAQVAAPPRSQPERYRRSAPRSVSDVTGSNQSQNTQQKQFSATPSGSGMASVGHLYTSSMSSAHVSDQKRMVISQGQAQQQRRNSLQTVVVRPGAAADDMQLYRHQSREEMKRFRRRSMPSLDSSDYTHLFNPQAATVTHPEEASAPRSPDKDKLKTAASEVLSRSKDGSSDSLSSMSSSSRPSSTNRNASNNAAPTVNPASTTTATVTDKDAADRNKDHLRLVNIPPRGSSDAANRLNNTSLSKAMTMDVGAEEEAQTGGVSRPTNGGATNSTSSTTPPPRTADDASRSAPGRTTAAMPSHLESPAMRHLSAINQKGGKLRSKTSRLRRAFSFGSAAELRKAAEASAHNHDESASKSQQEPTSDELYDAEQARIAQQQEEAGIGSSIYANARIFSGSTDNLSISSTASSASIMIRKMGRGMKKGTRSLVGLFRPKSIIAADDERYPEAHTATATNTAIEATVSMVTVEAEREHVDTNGMNSQNVGSNRFPRLERPSIDASRASTASDRVSSSGTDNSGPRKSIVGGEKERAEVLAAVRKGILKNRNGSQSPTRGFDSRSSTFDIQNPPPITESPASSAPSTPNDDAQGHKRTGSVAIGGEDYFVSALRLQQNSKSGSSTPQGSLRRNATFSPRIVFYDTWPSQEYDRRGEISTCNRLTPMLAQQIKEELNSFKMEMEVHETSKIYTHFF